MTIQFHTLPHVVFQHAVVPLGRYPQESSAGGAAGAWAAWVHYRGGGGQTNHPNVVKEVPETHTSCKSTHILYENIQYTFINFIHLQ